MIEQRFLSGLIKTNRAQMSFLLFIAITTLISSGNTALAKDGEPLDLKKASYLEIGATATPLLVSPAIGYWFGPVGVRVSGMYLHENSYESVLTIGYKISDTPETLQSINLVLGKTVGSDPGADYDFSYLGFAYGRNFSLFNHSGFYFELGLAKVLDDRLGNLADDPFVPCGSIGYVYRFIPK